MLPLTPTTTPQDLMDAVIPIVSKESEYLIGVHCLFSSEKFFYEFRKVAVCGDGACRPYSLFKESEYSAPFHSLLIYLDQNTKNGKEYKGLIKRIP